MNNLFPVDIDRHEQDCATPSCRTSCEQCCYSMFSRDNDNVVLNNYIVDNVFLGYSRTLFELVDINHRSMNRFFVFTRVELLIRTHLLLYKV